MNTRESPLPWDKAVVLWEWRTFEPLRTSDRARIESLPQKAVERLVDEYLVFPGRRDLNVKIRRRSFKVKRLLQETDAAQAWAHIEVPLPTSGEIVARLLGGEIAGDGEFSRAVSGDDLRALVTGVSGRIPEVASVRLNKTRQLFLLDVVGSRVRIELATVRRTGYRVVTLAIDARSRAQLREALRVLGLERYPACDYLEWLTAGKDA